MASALREIWKMRISECGVVGQVEKAREIRVFGVPQTRRPGDKSVWLEITQWKMLS
jgi:hypothetical protein